MCEMTGTIPSDLLLLAPANGSKRPVKKVDAYSSTVYVKLLWADWMCKLTGLAGGSEQIGKYRHCVHDAISRNGVDGCVPHDEGSAFER